MDTKTKVLEEMGAITPRDHDFSSDSWHGLTDQEREQFSEMYREAVRESDLPEARKQAAFLQAGAFGGLTLASAFKRYVRGREHWYA